MDAEERDSHMTLYTCVLLLTVIFGPLAGQKIVISIVGQIGMGQGREGREERLRALARSSKSLEELFILQICS